MLNGGTPITDSKIYWNSGVDNGAFSLLSDTTLGQNSYTHQSGLTGGVYYEFKVVATNAIGDGGYSATIRIIAASVPDPPTGLTKVSTSKTSVAFSWTEPSNNGGSVVTDYQIEWDAGNPALADSAFTILSATSYTVSSFSVTSGLTTGTSYRFRVRTLNDAGLSEPSSPLFSIYAATAPVAPSTPTVSFQNEETITIVWVEPTDTGGLPITGYVV